MVRNLADSNFFVYLIIITSCNEVLYAIFGSAFLLFPVFITKSRLIHDCLINPNLKLKCH